MIVWNRNNNQMKVDEIVFILDMSGSMNSIRSDVIGGFNRYIYEI